MARAFGSLDELAPSFDVVLRTRRLHSLKGFPNENVPASVDFHSQQFLFLHLELSQQVPFAQKFQVQSFLGLDHAQQQLPPICHDSGVIPILGHLLPCGDSVLHSAPNALPTAASSFVLDELLSQGAPSHEHCLSISPCPAFVGASLGHHSRPVHVGFIVILVVQNQLLIIVNVVIDYLAVAGSFVALEPLLDLHPLKVRESLSEPRPILNGVAGPIVGSPSWFARARQVWVDQLVVELLSAVGIDQEFASASHDVPGVVAIAIVADLLDSLRCPQVDWSARRVVHHHDWLLDGHDGVREGGQLLVLLDTGDRCIVHSRTTLHP